MRKLITLITLYCFNAAIVYAQPGGIDSSFGKNGVVKAHIGTGSKNRTSYKAIALQPDGKIVAVGYVTVKQMDIALARYNADGSPDSTFNGNGTQVTRLPGVYSNDASAVALQRDGKIVIAGYSLSASLEGTLVVARYNTNGSLDKSFDRDGFHKFKLSARTFPNSIAIQHNGKIVVAGFGYYGDTVKSFLLRCNINGSLDSSFGIKGEQANIVGLASSMTIDKDDKIVMLAFDSRGNILARYTRNGIPDSSFSGDGIQEFMSDIYTAPSDLALQRDGKVVITGRIVSAIIGHNDDIFVARYNTDGTKDGSFGNNGVQISDFGSFDYSLSIQIQTNGKIVIGGSVIARYTENGILEQAFNYQKEQIKDVFDSRFIDEIRIIHNRLIAVGRNQTAGTGIIAAYLLADLNTAPTIVLSTPAANGTYLAGGNVFLTATASDSDGTISKVEFYNGTTLLHTATDSPYTFKWLKVHLGNYSITAKATDNKGLVSTSAPLHIFVVPNTPPTVNITRERDQIYLKGATVHLQAAASDTDGRIVRVEFYSGTTLLATENKPPYTFDWRVRKTGNYMVTAKATDNWNAVTTSSVLFVSVVNNQLPAVSLIKPANEQTFIAPAVINLEAVAQDADGRIVQVSFFNGSTLLTDSEHKSPYTYQWQNVLAGTYTITAVAKDNWSAEATSSPITIKVLPKGEPQISSRSSSGEIKAGIHDNLNLHLSPNPAKNIVNLQVTGLQNNRQSTLLFISSSGIIVMTKQINSSMTIGLRQTIQLNVSSLASGMYIIKLISGDKIMYRRFMKM